MLHPVLRLIAFIILALTSVVRVVASEPFTTLHVFNGERAANFPSGGAMLHNGVLYGTTRGNSMSVSTGQGSLWGFDLASGQFTTLHQFDGPGDGRFVNSSIVVIGSHLYGTTASGGVGGGVLWSYDLNGGGYQTEFKFDDSSGKNPTNIIAVNDKLVGTLERPDLSLWSFDPDKDEFQTLHLNLGLRKPISLIAVGNKVYGTSFFGPGNDLWGGLWSYDLQTGDYKLLHGMDRRTDGRYPSGGCLSTTVHSTESTAGGQTASRTAASSGNTILRPKRSRCSTSSSQPPTDSLTPMAKCNCWATSSWVRRYTVETNPEELSGASISNPTNFTLSTTLAVPSVSRQASTSCTRGSSTARAWVEKSAACGRSRSPSLRRQHWRWRVS